ncbi:MAG TPA: BatD family protein [Candidatus Babeliales bacterium]|nr:BatD family protein [Candidatus Babeliales bacterium]
MDKIVGKIVLLVSLVMQSVVMHADVTLRARDANGKPLEQIVIGREFIVEVVLDGEHSRVRNPIVDNLKSLNVVAQSTQMQTMNGVTTVSYRYTVIGEPLGVLTIGPVYVVHNNKKVESNVLTVAVVDHQLEQSDRTMVDDEALVMVRLVCDKKQVVVGETVRCSLQYLYKDERVNLIGVEEPRWGKCHVNKQGDSRATTELVDGVEYDCLTTSWDMHVMEPGTVTIPGVRADVQVPVSPRDRFDQYSFFFRTSHQKKRLYSNAVNLIVDPLPEYNGTVHAVGSFSQLKASLKPTVAKIGEGMVFSLSARWSKYCNIIEAPTILQIPEGFTSYDSKQSTTHVSPDEGVVSFEYIMQGMKPGDWEIPSQTFTYFDIKTRNYITLSSEPLSVTILGTALSRKNELGSSAGAQQVESGNITTANGQSDQHNDIHSIISNDIWYSRSVREIPLSFFLLLLLVPILGIIFFLLQSMWLWYKDKNELVIRKKRGFMLARRALQQAEQQHAAGQLYFIFIQLFVARFGLPESALSQDVIAERLARAGMLVDDIHAWNSFFSQIAELVFFNKTIDDQSAIALFTQAHAWLTVFEQTI